MFYFSVRWYIVYVSNGCYTEFSAWLWLLGGLVNRAVSSPCIAVYKSLATASGGRRQQLGASNFTDQCYQMALCKRSRLIIIFPSTRERYTHAGWAFRRSSLVYQVTNTVILQFKISKIGGNWWKFDEVLTKTICTVFWDTVYSTLISILIAISVQAYFIHFNHCVTGDIRK